ncbi:MAG: tetratricopeptide repeat protein [Bacteroidia bacterium]
MKKISSIILFLVFAATTAPIIAQDTEEQLAIQHYQEGEFDKALPMFEKLFWKNSESNYLYDYYFNTMMKLREYDEAEKSLKKLTRKHPENPGYYVDLGYVYEQAGDKKKSEEAYTEAINELTVDMGKISRVANAFIRRQKTEYAIQAYLKARQLMRDKNLLAVQLATLYQQQGDLEKMMEEHLNMLRESPGYLESMQNNLQDLVVDDQNYEELRVILLKKVQSEPNSRQLTELLSWLFVQKKDFRAALVQLKALDRRMKEQGERLLPLAEIAMSNGAYDVAEDIYTYIASLGEEGYYYQAAKRGFLRIRYDRITKLNNYSREDLTGLVAAYEDFLQDYHARDAIWAEAVMNNAKIKAVYLDEPEEAINYIDPVIEGLSLDRFTKAEAKIAKADYMVMANDIWEAALLYKQVQQDFKDHPLGSMAKFKDARLSFYRGEFEWAKAQLDVLKGSTSELISNDALQLSMTITDNLGLDTTDVPLKLFAEADFNFFQNKFATAEAKFDTILLKFPGHSLTDEIHYRRGNIRSRQRKFQEAVEYYAKVYTLFGDDILADDALFKAATIYQNSLNNNEKAKELYEKLILKHPDSIYAVEARKRYRLLRGDIMN